MRLRQPLACVVFGPEAGLEPEETEALALKMAEQVGRILRESGRASDAIGRLGAAEFAVIAPATEAQGAVRMVERLGDVLERLPISNGAGNHALRVRAGYCAVPDFAASPVDAVEMLLRATSALRHLRAEGNSDRVRAFEQLPVPPLH